MQNWSDLQQNAQVTTSRNESKAVGFLNLTIEVNGEKVRLGGIAIDPDAKGISGNAQLIHEGLKVRIERYLADGDESHLNVDLGKLGLQTVLNPAGKKVSIEGSAEDIANML